MRIGFVGMGKLGFPCALAASKGHDVLGYDVSPSAKEILQSRKYPHREVGAQELLENTTLRVTDSIDETVAHADIVFVAVQTPHGPLYEGITRMPESRADFDYTALRQAVGAIAESAKTQKKPVAVVVISTTLPGTCRREVYPLLNEYTGFAYNPFFIAMSTTIGDYLKPEMVLIGFDPVVNGRAQYATLERVQNFYKTIHQSPHAVMSVPSAELAKVGYNVFLGLKIVAANAMMEIAHKIEGTNCDDVSRALSLATDRVISSKYMFGGMGDGGNCFVEGELIHVEDGVRAIDEIEKGDRVLGGDGKFHEVLETYRRPYKGKVYTIKGRGLTRFTVTGEHPLHVSDDLREVRADGRRDQTKGPQLGPVREVRADRLSSDGVYLTFPAPRDTSERELWLPSRGKSGPAPYPIFVDNEDYVRLAGYYLAEGSIWLDRAKNYLPTRVQFSFNSTTDSDYVAEVIELLKTIAPKANIRVDRARESCVNVIINSTQLAKVLDHDFGNGCEEKRLPAWILNSDRNSALCLRGMFRGDGCSGSQGFSFSTVSPQLAHGVSLMLRRHGISSALQFYPKRVGTDGVVHRPAFDLDVRNAAYIEKLAEIVGMPIRHQMQEKQYPNVIFERNGVWYHYIHSVEISDYEGTVYNLNVADVHNYVSVGGLVSNCHPRDQIALSWLADELCLSYDLFGAMIDAREMQTEWLADLCVSEAQQAKMPIVILGKAYKKGTNLTGGSPAILLKNILDEYDGFQIDQWDPHVDGIPAVGSPDFRPWMLQGIPAVFVIGTDHDEFYQMEFTRGSTVIDPWGKMKDIDGVKVIRVGRQG